MYILIIINSFIKFSHINSLSISLELSSRTLNTLISAFWMEILSNLIYHSSVLIFFLKIKNSKYYWIFTTLLLQKGWSMN